MRLMVGRWYDDLRLLVDGGEQSAYWAATLLGRLGEEAAAAAGPLGQSLTQSFHASVRQRAAWALQRLGPAALR